MGTVNSISAGLLGEAILEEREFYPLSQSQMGIYLSCLNDPETDMYNIPYHYSFEKDKIDAARLAAAIKEAVSGHEIFRCRIVTRGGEPAMEVGSPEFDVPVIGTSEAELQKELAGFVRSVRITDEVLFRAAIFETEEKYYPVFVAHHVIFDGSSFGVISDEAALIYNGGKPEREIVPGDRLGIFEEKLESAGGYDEGREFFRQRFEGNDARTQIIPDVNVDGAAPVNRCVTIYSDDTLSAAQVEEFNGGKGVGMFFIAAFAYALAKFTGQEETVFCTVNHGRSDERLKKAVGMMVRTLPVYTKIDENMPVRDFLASVKGEVKELIVKGNYPFTRLASEYGLSMDTAFTYQGESFNKMRLGETESFMTRLVPRDPLSPVNFNVFKEKDRYKLLIYYREDMYTEGYIRSFGEMYLQIISEFIKREYLRDVVLISEKEKARLDGFNDTASAYDRSRTAVDLFLEQARKAPDNIAAVFREKKFTYRQADEISEKIAGHIRSLGIGREDVVSVLIPRCEYMVLASLGVLRSGAAYQPLDPTYPPERLSFMIKDSAAKLLIADEQLLSLVPDYDGKVLLTGDIPSLPECDASGGLPKPGDLFILLYTSGSTGVPKGVMLEHGNIAAFCNWYRKYYSLTPDSRVAAYASYGFDACMMDMYPALTTGAQVHILAEEIRLDLDAIGGYFDENGITHSFMTTQVGRMFASTVESRSLKHLSTGGEALVPVEPPEYAFYNVYGPTECTIFTTTHRVDRLYSRVPIGKALDNMKLYITDKQGRRLPAGACGELCAAGHQVGRGYLARPELTAFTKNPFSEEEGYERMYRTGDIVRYLSDGSVDFVGRRDGQVKIRGFRIELSEVESVIREFRGIKDAAVVAKDAAGGGKYIAAYIVSDERIDIGALNDFIAENKPPYMVPAATAQIDAIPLNANGKVDKRKLPDISVSQPEEEAPARPLTFIEEKLCGIVSGIIGQEISNVGTDLMKAGLTSITAIKFAALLKREFGFEADVKRLMKGCSVISVENDIQRQLLEGARAPRAEEAKSPRKKTYPLSKSQLGVYADCMKDPHTIKYNIPFVLAFPAGTDAEKLAENVKKVIAAHPYINTCLTTETGDAEQLFAESAEAVIPVIRLSEERLPELRSDFAKPFNLFKAPLYRMNVVETEKAVYLFADIHHIIFDGGSLDLFLRQLKEVCEGGAVEKEDYEYYDHVDSEVSSENGAEYKKAESFFAQALRECEAASEITPDLGGLFENGALAEICAVTDFEGAKDFCRGNGITPAHLYCAAAAYTVSRFTNSRNVYLSTISNGRSDLRLTGCFGMFVRTVPLAISVDDCTAAGFAAKVKEAFTGAVDNEIFPYSEICRRYSYAPKIMYEYQLGVTEKLTVNGSAVSLELIGSSEAKFSVSVRIEERDGRPCVVVQYNDALYSRELMQTFADCIETAMRGMIAAPQSPVRKISLLDEKQRKLTESFEHTDTTPAENKLMQEGFEKLALKYPDRTALIACDRTLSYGELDRLANAAANVLTAKGLKKGGRAVILLSRTSKLITAVLGVLKAGGTFIPTVPDYPEERIKSIIEDSGAELVITEGGLLSRYENAVDVDLLLSGEDFRKPDAGLSPDDLAYMIYTSGSTGKPKGVMLRHEGIANYLTDCEANIQIRFPAKYGSVYCSVTTVSFDMSMKEIWGALSGGLTLAFADDEQSKDPALLAEFMKKNSVDVFNATPSRLLQYMELESFAKAVSGCKVILSGGEKYPDKLLSLLREKTEAKILNTYGPTEITVSSNAKDLTAADRISVGRPLLNYYEYIVDCDGNRLPAGVAGELIIAGCGVAAGYCGLPEQNAKAFIEFEGRRAYRSGDYAKWTSGGDVVILGRTDNQIKLRGLRIELDEITKRLTGIDGVRSAAVIIRKLGNADAVCAYYTSERELETEFIKSELKKNLTDYMIPSSFDRLPEMPLTANGKVNIKALPEPVPAERGGGREPGTALERKFCEIFAEILELPKVYADDSFFDLGGSSLTVTRVIIAANRAGINIAYGDVFSRPTPAQLAAFAGKDGGSTGFDDLSDYDYTAINALLAENNLESFLGGERRSIGNVMLTGAAGFLGIHILHELLERYDGRVYCMLRGKKGQTAESRLNGVYYYYFEKVLKTGYADRVIVTEGDVTNKASFERFAGYDIDTVIHCAANVKHFSKGTDIEDVNYYGTLNVIDFCKSKKCRLIHVSTMSVGGIFVGAPGSVSELREDQLFFGQSQMSKYTQSKFMAERAVLEEAAKGLSAKIMRVGTLSARDADGEYQINFTTNTFMARLKSNIIVGKYPYEVIEQPFEFSPIDCVAGAILLLAQTPEKCRVFHPFNNNTLIMGNLYEQMDKEGLHSEPCEMCEYISALEKAKSDPEKAKVLSGLIAYQNAAHGQKTYSVGKSNKFTMQVLYRMGFRWPLTSENYMRRFVKALSGLGFFDVER